MIYITVYTSDPDHSAQGFSKGLQTTLIGCDSDPDHSAQGFSKGLQTTLIGCDLIVSAKFDPLNLTLQLFRKFHLFYFLCVVSIILSYFQHPKFYFCLSQCMSLELIKGLQYNTINVDLN